MSYETGTEYRYWAFISYSSRDAAHAIWLQRAIETYGIPARLVEHEHTTPAGDPVPRRFHPIFRDRDELSASADLGQAIEAALAASRYLIVICSPNAAGSRWVNREIEAFAALGRSDRILAYIVAGEPNAGAERECFPPALQQHEPLAADARRQGDGRNDAKLKLLAGMLGLSFDALRQRDAQRRVRRLQAVVAAALLLTLVFGALALYAYQARARAVVAEAGAVAESHMRATAEANAVAEAHVRATAEARAVDEAQARATAQAATEEERKIAVARQLAAQAQAIDQSSGQLNIATLLAVEALRRDTDLDASLFLQQNLDRLPVPRFRLAFSAAISETVFSPAGDKVALATADRQIHLIAMADGKPLGDLAAAAAVDRVVFCADGSQVLAVEATQAELWSLTGARPRQRIPLPAGGANVSFDPSGRRLRLSDPAGQQQLWDIGQGRFSGDLAAGPSEPVAGSAGSSPSGEWITTYAGPAVRLWRADKPEAAMTLTLEGRVGLVSLNHRGSIAVISHDCSAAPAGAACQPIGVVDLAQRKVVAQLGEPGQTFESLLFTNDDALLIGTVSGMMRFDNRELDLFGGNASAAQGTVPSRPVFVWRTDTWKQQATADFPADQTIFHLKRPLALSFAQDVVTTWDLATGRVQSQFSAGRDIAEVHFVPGAFPQWVTTTPAWRNCPRARCVDALEVWDVRSGSVVSQLFPPDLGNENFVVDPTEQAAIGWNLGSNLAVAWELAPRTRVASDVSTRFSNANSPAQKTAFNADGSWLLAAHGQGDLYLWRLPLEAGVEGGTLYPARNLSDVNWSFALSPDGRSVAVSTQGHVEIRELATGKVTATIPLSGGLFGFSKDGSRLVVGDNQNGTSSAVVWDLAEARPVVRVSAPPLKAYFALNAAGTRLASEEVTNGSGSIDRYHVYDLEQGKELMSAPGRDWAFNASGTLLAVLTKESKVQLWDVDRGTVVSETNVGDLGEVAKLAFDGDARLYIAGSRFSIRSLPDLAETASWPLGEVGFLDISANGKWVFFTQGTGGSYIVDAHTGQRLAKLWVPAAAAYKIAFAPGDDRVLVTGVNSAHRLLTWQPEALIAAACARLTRNLTETEWSVYLPGEPYHKTCPALPTP